MTAPLRVYHQYFFQVTSQVSQHLYWKDILFNSWYQHRNIKSNTFVEENWRGPIHTHTPCENLVPDKEGISTQCWMDCSTLLRYNWSILNCTYLKYTIWYVLTCSYSQNHHRNEDNVYITPTFLVPLVTSPPWPPRPHSTTIPDNEWSAFCNYRLVSIF